jgi:hypothetical protein
MDTIPRTGADSAITTLLDQIFWLIEENLELRKLFRFYEELTRQQSAVLRQLRDELKRERERQP